MTVFEDGHTETMVPLAQDYSQRLTVRTDIQFHMPTLHEAVTSRPGAVVIELGIRTGNSTCAFLAAIEQAGGELWSVDRARAMVPQEWLHLPFWHVLQHDSTSQDARDWLPQACDVFFADTIHEYGKTLEELRAYVPRVRPGGVVLVHDPDYEGWHGEMKQPQPAFPVAQALDDFCEETGLSWKRWPGENWPGSYGMGIIEVAG